jgi:hypothetical protein
MNASKGFWLECLECSVFDFTTQVCESSTYHSYLTTYTSDCMQQACELPCELLVHMFV